MLPSIKELHRCEVGDEEYWLRTPTVFDLPRMRRDVSIIARRPVLHEFKIASLAGIAAIGELVDEVEEAERQRGVIEQWYEMLVPLREDDIDEPDQEKRTVLLIAQQAERHEAQVAILGEVAAIEANLERHWPPFAQLSADRRYRQDVENIMVVRLLLRKRGTVTLGRDAEGLLAEEAYLALPDAALPALQAFAEALLVPGETQRKN